MTEQSKIPLPEGEQGKSLFERAEGSFGGFEGFKPAPVPKELAEPANRRWKKPEAKAAPQADPPAAPVPAPEFPAREPEGSAERITFTAKPQAIDRARLQQEGLIVPGGPVTALVEEFRIVKRQILLAARETRLDGVDQQDFAILLAGDRQREVGRAESLALARQRRADQHALPGARHAVETGLARREQDLPLDNAELLGERGDRPVADDQALLLEAGAIEALRFGGEGDSSGRNLFSPLPLRERVGRGVGGVSRRVRGGPLSLRP